MQTVLSTPDSWRIRCKACVFHDIPKHTNQYWEYNEDPISPTFTPSFNEFVNSRFSIGHNPDLKWTDQQGPERRCHFFIKDGIINYCSDSTHSLAGQTYKLEPWSKVEIMMYRKTEVSK